MRGGGGLLQYIVSNALLKNKETPPLTVRLKKKNISRTFFCAGLMSIASPATYFTQGFAMRIGSVMLRTSTVPTLAAASIGVKMK